MGKQCLRRSPGRVAAVVAMLLAVVFSVLDPGGSADRGSSVDGGAVSVAAPALPSAPGIVDEAAVPSPTADTADEAVRTLPVRAPLLTHAGAPLSVALPAPADPWHVLAAGGPPGFRAPDRATGPLLRTAPRADRAPPAPAGI